MQINLLIGIATNSCHLHAFIYKLICAYVVLFASYIYTYRLHCQVVQWALHSGYATVTEKRDWGWNVLSHAIIGNAPEILHWLAAEGKLVRALVDQADDEVCFCMWWCVCVCKYIMYMRLVFVCVCMYVCVSIISP